MISATMSLYSISDKVYDGVLVCVSVCVRGPGDEIVHFSQLQGTSALEVTMQRELMEAYEDSLIYD